MAARPARGRRDGRARAEAAATLAHLRVGQGARPLLLLHGFLGAARNLRSLARRLAAVRPELSVFALDLTGHGGSPPLPPGADLATLARDVLATARALRLAGPWAVAGHSLGGRVALRAAGRVPAPLARLILLDIGPAPVAMTEAGRLVDLLLAAPAAGPSRDLFRGHFRRGGLADPVVEWLLQNLAPEAGGYRWRIDRTALAELHARAGAEELWAAVEGPRPYALACIRGARSAYVPEAEARRLEAAGCPVDTLEGAGHFLHVERPDALAERLDARLG
jgi:esterase